MNKLLILDKSVFHKSVLSKKGKDELVAFVKCHNVILPHALCVECAISQENNPPENSKDPIMLTQILLDLVKSGAYAGKSPARIVEEERATNAAIKSLIDVEQTEIVRKAIIDEKPDIEKARRMCEEAFKPITHIVKQWMSSYHKTIHEKKKEKDFREEASKKDLVRRLKKWLLAADKMKGSILETYFGNGVNYISDDRWEWQMLRLSLAWGTELASKRNMSGPSFEGHDMSNDIFDIHYVSHLSQAGGLVTGDTKLTQPLAGAAFPDKDVFESIHDVPNSYCTCQ